MYFPEICSNVCDGDAYMWSLLELWKTYMVVNIRTREISRDTHKLTRILILKNNKKKSSFYPLLFFKKNEIKMMRSPIDGCFFFEVGLINFSLRWESRYHKWRFRCCPRDYCCMLLLYGSELEFSPFHREA
jgi:hypothetical protein